MPKKKPENKEQRGILYAIMILLLFILVVLLLLGGAFLFHVHKDFYSAFRTRLDSGFYLSAWLILLFSSLLYTPFSYGISHYFIEGNGGFREVFFLFRRPVLLTKATAVSALKKALTYLERLLLLLLAALLEVVLFFSFLVVSGKDIFSLREDPFRLAAEYMLRSPWLIGLSILLWCGVLFGMLVIYLRYILCKYVLLLYPDAGVFQALRVGRAAIKGRLWGTMIFYLRYGAYCILAVLSLGLSARMIRHKSFSAYACGLVEDGWSRYCRHRSRRS